WVAANRQTICNSDPVLDLGETARANGLRLRHCLSTPLIDSDDLIGALSLYSTEFSGFTDDHRRAIEAVGNQVSRTIAQAIEFDRRSAGAPSRAIALATQLEPMIVTTRHSGG